MLEILATHKAGVIQDVTVILVFFYKQLLNLILIDTAILKDFILNVSEFNSSVVLKLLIASASPGGLLKHKVYPQSS